MFLQNKTKKYTEDYSDKIKLLKGKLSEADAVLIGAGAGLSTAAGFEYAGDRFNLYFADFEARYGFHDMYTGGFYPYETPEEMWAFWSRYIYINRYMNAPVPVYDSLYQVVKDKDYFVLTTNVDHCFQKAGFDKNRLFYTQGDYGLWQCSSPCSHDTYDNEEAVRGMVLAQGFEIAGNGNLIRPDNKKITMTIPTRLVPRCPNCAKPLTMNLRSDNRFAQDEGWYEAAERYEKFVLGHQNMNMVYLELGVGNNTPGIIKYNFWSQVNQNPRATYISINMANEDVPEQIKDRSIYIKENSASIMAKLAEAE